MNQSPRAAAGLGALVVLLIDVFVDLQLGLEGVEDAALGEEVEVHEMTTGDVAGAERKLAFAEVVDLLKLAACLFDFFAHGADEGVDAFFFAFRVEHDHGFVFAFHGVWIQLGV